MNNARCPTTAELTAYAMGDRDPGLIRHIESHLETCSLCRSMVEKQQADREWLDGLLSDNLRNKLRQHTNPAMNPAQSVESEPPSQQAEPRSLPGPVADLLRAGILEPSTEPSSLACFGAYDVVEYIGRGGMGIVLKAREKSLNRTVAIKILRPELAEDYEAVARFEREARAFAALKHPSIVGIYHIGTCSSVPFIAMEYIHGRNLRDRIRRDGPLSSPDIRTILKDLLSAVQAAHEAGYIHRDIKSSNVILSPLNKPDEPEASSGAESTRAYLTDFGLARMLHSHTQLTVDATLMGTPEYMSPEQAQGLDTVDHRSDLYSIGVVLYEMITGRTPFQADTPTAIIHQVIHVTPEEPITLVKTIDPDLSALASRLLAKNPNHRFQSAQDVLNVLEKQERVINLERRRNRRLRLVGTLTLLLVIAAGLWLMNTKPPLTAVRPSDEKDGILARYGNHADWETFFQFTPEETGEIRESRLISWGDSDHLDYVGFCRNAYSLSRDSGNRLIAFSLFDSSARKLWDYAFDDRGIRPFSSPGDTHYWVGAACMAGEIDTDPGTDIALALVHKDNSTSSIVLLDSETGLERNPDNRLWHHGHMVGMDLVDDYFAPGRPAILAWAYNNGLSSPYVMALMILDPQNMGGLAPPYRENKGLPRANIHAYAWLDFPCGRQQLDKTGCVRNIDEKDRVILDHAEPHWPSSEGPATEQDDLEFELYIHVCKGSRVAIHPFRIVLDRNLNFLSTGADSPTTTGFDPDDYRKQWKTRWKPIIQKGQWLDSSALAEGK